MLALNDVARLKKRAHCHDRRVSGILLVIFLSLATTYSSFNRSQAMELTCIKGKSQIKISGGAPVCPRGSTLPNKTYNIFDKAHGLVATMPISKMVSFIDVWQKYGVIQYQDNSFSIFDTASFKIVATNLMFSQPVDILTVVGTKILAVNREPIISVDAERSHEISYFDFATPTHTEQIVDVGTTLNFTDGVEGFAVVGTNVYLNTGQYFIQVLDTLTMQISNRIDLEHTEYGPIPEGMTSVGTKVYAVDQFNHLFVIDSTTNTVIKTLNVGGGESWLYLSGNNIFTLNRQFKIVDVIDTSTDSISRPFGVGGISFVARGDRSAFTSNSWGAWSAPGKLFGQIYGDAVGFNVRAVAYILDLKQRYVTSTLSSKGQIAGIFGHYAYIAQDGVVNVMKI